MQCYRVTERKFKLDIVLELLYRHVDVRIADLGAEIGDV
jgi:hypothetical protein